MARSDGTAFGPVTCDVDLLLYFIKLNCLLNHHDASSDYNVDFLLEPLTLLGAVACIIFDAVAMRLSRAVFQL